MDATWETINNSHNQRLTLADGRSWERAKDSPWCYNDGYPFSILKRIYQRYFVPSGDTSRHDDTPYYGRGVPVAYAETSIDTTTPGTISEEGIAWLAWMAGLFAAAVQTPTMSGTVALLQPAIDAGLLTASEAREIAGNLRTDAAWHIRHKLPAAERPVWGQQWMRLKHHADDLQYRPRDDPERSAADDAFGEFAWRS